MAIGRSPHAPDLFFPGGVSRGLLLYSAGSAEGIKHRVVTLVARVFKILVTRLLRYRKHDFPWPGVCLWIVDDHFVLNSAWIRARVSLRQLQRVACRRAAAVETDTC